MTFFFPFLYKFPIFSSKLIRTVAISARLPKITRNLSNQRFFLFWRGGMVTCVLAINGGFHALGPGGYCRGTTLGGAAKIGILTSAPTTRGADRSARDPTVRSGHVDGHEAPEAAVPQVSSCRLVGHSVLWFFFFFCVHLISPGKLSDATGGGGRHVSTAHWPTAETDFSLSFFFFRFYFFFFGGWRFQQ